MAVTPHTDSIDETFTLSIGNQSWRAMLAAVYPGMQLGHKFFSWKVLTGGPVAIAKKPMAAIGDGYSRAIADPEDVEPVSSRDEVIQGALINFFATANGDKIRVRASNR